MQIGRITIRLTIHLRVSSSSCPGSLSWNPEEQLDYHVLQHLIMPHFGSQSLMADVRAMTIRK